VFYKKEEIVQSRQSLLSSRPRNRTSTNPQVS